jgi:hypothetical protein
VAQFAYSSATHLVFRAVKVTDYLAYILDLIRPAFFRILAVGLMLAVVVAMTAPFASGFNGNSCAMACCKAMPEHEAGTCSMHGPPPAPAVAQRPADDPLCDPAQAQNKPATPSATVTIVAGTVDDDCDTAVSGEHGSNATKPGSSHLSTLKLSAPCGQECSAGGGSSSQSRSGREPFSTASSAIHGWDRIANREAPNYALAAVRQTPRRCAIPRGPPTTPQA